VAAAVQLPAAVKVDTSQPIERFVAFRVTTNKYICTTPSNSLGLATGNIDSKEEFTVIDFTRGNLQDGDEVRIRYTPHSAKEADPARSTYWMVNSVGVRRGHDGDIFKLKRVGTMFALVTPTGKFVALPTNSIGLGVSDNQDGALLVEIIDANSGASVIKAPDLPAPGSTAPAAPASTPSSTPDQTKTPPPPPSPAPPPATDKPASQ
jgi:hypothetical protein